MSDQLRNAVQAIRGIKIPELSEEIIMLEKEIKSRFANAARITEIISMNTTLSGEVMRIVNSPVMKLKEPVNSIRDAVAVMGFDNIYNLVIAAALKNVFGSKGLHKDIMEHSVDVAFCMADLADCVDDISRDEAYMLGLFHNVGALMLATKDDEGYDALFRNSLSRPTSVIKKEQEAYHSDHAVIGVIVGKKWRLPVDMLTAIMFHHDVKCEEIKSDRVRAMVAMIKVASGIVSEISLGAYRGGEMTEYENDGLKDLMLPEGMMTEIRRALMSYSFKESAVSA